MTSSIMVDINAALSDLILSVSSERTIPSCLPMDLTDDAARYAFGERLPRKIG